METPSKPPVPSDPAAVDATEDRRGFLAQAAVLAMGGVGLSVPVLTAVVAFLNPLGQKSRAGRLIRITSLGVLPEDGTPRRFPVIAERTDAWSHYPPEPIGAVYLRRTQNKKKPVEALQSRCPHAGCPIQFRTTSDGGEFYCPCHSNPRFDLAGMPKKIPSDSPRPMDTLEVNLQRLQEGEVWVKFQNFEQGTSKKVEKA